MTKLTLGKIEAPYWDDKPLAIVAGGPSLIGFDFNALKDFHVLAVKGSIFDLPWASAGFGLDTPRYLEWLDGGKFDRVKMPVYWAVDPTSLPVQSREQPACVTLIERQQGSTMSDDPRVIYNGSSSGFGAFNIAWLKRARRIALFGYDYKEEKTGPQHHNDQHYLKKRKQTPGRWKGWAMQFDQLTRQCEKAGVMVVNGCHDSQIEAFPRMKPQQALEWMKSWQEMKTTS